ncbi:MAG TPA: imidazoleglycerol-phosphate dehydratase [Thermoanaerobaculia bacterium]|nr:imidazoleglycerol-phosphate dehydratase [Thermoanaerobaculia bacterium]
MTATIRETAETSVRVELRRGSGAGTIETGVPFLDHMLTALARYSGLDLDISARGDLRHHIIEDVALTLGRAFKDNISAGAARYGSRTVPMDDALVQATVDIGGRPYYQGPLPNKLYDHWMRSFSDEAKATIHIVVVRGTDRHHIIEAAFKALGFALRDALVDTGATMSTKGRVSVRVE